MSSIRLDKISKTFGAASALASLSLEIPQGEFFSVLGPSGCGKTTLLRIIAGLETPSGGKIFIDGADVTELPPQKRNVGIVFQSYALFPHMTVQENVAYGLEVQKLSRAEIRRKVGEVLEKVRLSDKADAPVPTLSGGEQQRVAVARAVVVAPRVLLFDEPLSNLDYALRLETRGEIKRLQHEVGITTVYVTHDQGEALALSDRIALLNKGRLLQVGTPSELYFRPANSFAASFIGHANLFSAKRCAELFHRRGLKEGEFLAVLPEEIVLARRGDGVRARIVDKQFSGSLVEYTLDCAGEIIKATRPVSTKDFSGAVGEFISLGVPPRLQRTVKDE